MLGHTVGSNYVGSKYVGSHCVGSHCVGSHCIGSHRVGSHCIGVALYGSHYVGWWFKANFKIPTKNHHKMSKIPHCELPEVETDLDIKMLSNIRS